MGYLNYGLNTPHSYPLDFLLHFQSLNSSRDSTVSRCYVLPYMYVFMFSVMDGEDLSKYDSNDAVTRRRQVDTDDMETLEQLEWELASQTGRITGASLV